MNKENQPRKGPMSADPEFRTVYAPETYASASKGPILYSPFVINDKLAGYLWISELEEAAGYIWQGINQAEPKKNSADAFNAAVYWRELLVKAKAEKLHPKEALESWIGQQHKFDGKLGQSKSISSLEILRALFETETIQDM